MTSYPGLVPMHPGLCQLSEGRRVTESRAGIPGSSWVVTQGQALEELCVRFNAMPSLLKILQPVFNRDSHFYFPLGTVSDLSPHLTPFLARVSSGLFSTCEKHLTEQGWMDA